MCLRYKSAVTVSRQTGRLYQSSAWRSPWERAQRDSPPPSGPLLSTRGRGEEKRKEAAQPQSNSHSAAGPSHTGTGALDTRLTLEPETLGPKKEKVAENMPASQKLPFSRTSTSEHQGVSPRGVYFMFFPQREREVQPRPAGIPGSLVPSAWAAAHAPPPLLLRSAEAAAASEQITPFAIPSSNGSV